MRGLAGRGHEAVLFASGDSDAGVPVGPVLPRHADADLPWHVHGGTDRLRRHVGRACAEAAPALVNGAFDIIQNNSLHPILPALARRERSPMLTSLHVRPFAALAEGLRDHAAEWSLISACSAAHLRSWWGDEPPDRAHVVPNGICGQTWAFRPVSGYRPAVWVGRKSRTKAPHLAIAAARIAGLPLDLAGPIDDASYFESDVRPLLGGRVRNRGALSGSILREFVAGASVPVATSDWDEPFGLAAVEAMASGVPVAGTDRGAMREVVGDAGVIAPNGDATALARAALAAMEIPRPPGRGSGRYDVSASTG